MDVTERLERALPGQAPWALVQELAGGSQSAHLVTDVGHKPFVVKRHEGAQALASEFASTVRRIDLLRARGVPAPHTAAIPECDGMLLVLEHMPGTANPPVTCGLATQLLQFNELQEGLGDGPAGVWRDLMRQTLVAGLVGYCEHDSLRTFSRESEALLQRVRRAGHEAHWDEIPADDLVHYDLHLSNVLGVEDRVTGIVDWDAVRPGDRALDLAMLAFTSTLRSQSSAVELLWSAFLGHGNEQRRSVAVHHTVLRLADWFIRHNPAHEANRTVELAHEALRRTSQTCGP